MPTFAGEHPCKDTGAGNSGANTRGEGMGAGPGDPYELKEQIPATLIFETAGRVDVAFRVESRKDGVEEMDHSDH